MQPALKRLNSRVIYNADDVVRQAVPWIKRLPEEYVLDFGSSGHGLAYSGLRGLLSLGGRVEETRFSNQTGRLVCIVYETVAAATCRLRDKEEGCSVWIVLFLYLSRLCATPSYGYDHGDWELLLKHSSSFRKHIPGYCEFEPCTQTPSQKHQAWVRFF